MNDKLTEIRERLETGFYYDFPSYTDEAMHVMLDEVKRLNEMLRAGSSTERAPTQEAYDRTCAALVKWKNRARELEYGTENLKVTGIVHERK